MATTRVRHIGEVPATTVASTFNTSDVSLSIASATGQPSVFPFDVIISRTNAAQRERIRVGGRATTTYNTITRGIDGTTAKLHNVNEPVEVCLSASNLDELNQMLGVLTSAGDLLYYDGSNFVRLGLGASGTLLQGGASAPSWLAAGGAGTILTGGTPSSWLAAGVAETTLKGGGAPAFSFKSIPVFVSVGSRDSAITSPVRGMVCYVSSNDVFEGFYTYNGTTWRAQSWNMPWGLVTAPVSLTANQTGFLVNADVAGSTITWTVVGNRYYRLVAHVRTAQQGGAGGTSNLFIADAGNATQGSSQQTCSNPGDSTTHHIDVVRTFTAGSLSLHLRLGSTAAIDLQGSSASPCVFYIEDIGPSGAPT